MTNKHEKKFLRNMLIGFLLTTSGIAAVIYAAFTEVHKLDWIFWAAISAVTINAGLLFLGSALIHKVKADLIRRQKQKNESRKLDADIGVN